MPKKTKPADRGNRATSISDLRAQHVARATAPAVVAPPPKDGKRFDALRAMLNKKYKGEVFTTIANGTRASNISAVRSGWQELDDLITGETDANARTVAGTGLGWPLGRIIEIYGENGMGKALEISTPVLTPTGFVAIGSLSIGDYVIGSDGTKTQVIGVFNQGIKPALEVTTTDGGSVVCCSEHLWTTTLDNESSPKVRTTDEIKETLSYKTSGYSRHRLPIVKPVEFSSSGELPLDPYLLGCLLGDGGLTGGSIVIHKPENDVLEECTKRLPVGDTGVLFDDGNGPGSALRIKREKFDSAKSETSKALSHLGLLGSKSIDKFIPDCYLYTSKSHRLELLQGLIDTDGHVNSSGCNIEFSTSSEQLAIGIVFLARSLGAIVSTTARTPMYTYRGERRQGHVSYRSRIRFVDTTCPVVSAKNIAKWKGGDKSPRFRCIKSIEPAGDAEFVCIKVDADDGLFVVDDFIVTHNTTLSLHIIAAFQRIGKRCAFIDAEHALDVSYASKLGVDLTTLMLNQPDRGGEQALDIVTSLAESGVFGCIVVDSVAALTPLAELELDFEDNSQPGGHARLMSRALRKMCSIVASKDVLLVFLNQTRLKIGVRFGSPKTTTGGEALKFYASIRLEMVNVKTQKKGDRVIFRRTRIRTVKNKCAAPFRDVFVDLAPSRGITAIHGDPDLGGGSDEE